MQRQQLNKFGFTIIGSLLLISLLVVGCSKTASLNPTQQSGYKVFKSYCFGCHSINGDGGEVGPNLTKIGSLRDKTWLVSWIKNPKAINPNSNMPTLNLSDQKINDVAEYLTTLK